MPLERATATNRDTYAGDRAGGGTSILDELMTARQMAGALQMRVSTVEEYARRGLLPSVKLGRHRRFVRSEVELAIVGLAEQSRHGFIATGRPAARRAGRIPSSGHC